MQTGVKDIAPALCRTPGHCGRGFCMLAAAPAILLLSPSRRGDSELSGIEEVEKTPVPARR